MSTDQITPTVRRPPAEEESSAHVRLAMAAARDAASRALRAGARAPLFTLATGDERPMSLETLLRAGPVVLHFFRGAWCAYGEQSVTEFASTYERVVALGASAVAIAPPGAASMTSAPLPMPELQDIDMKVARAYGLAFELPAALRPRYTQLGYTPPTTKQTGSWLVPIPATYLVDRDGVIALAYVDVDYRKRFDADSLMTALSALKARAAASGERDRRLL